MEEMTRAEKFVERLVESGKLWDIALTLLSLAAMVAAG